MEINSIWDKRLKEFYNEIIRYFSIIAMSIVYSFIIFGSVFLYYYLKFLYWLPPSFPTELIAVLLITFLFLQTRVRTFIKKADIIFLMPAEARLSLYFRKSMFYSAIMDSIKLLILMIILSPLIRHNENSIVTFLVIFIGLIILNIRLVWVEQWLTNKFQLIVHRLIRFLLFSTILYFLFTGIWAIAGILMMINFVLWFYVLSKHMRGINWAFLINQEEKILENIYKFINIYIDVPHLKYSFKHRRLIGWTIKKVIPYKQSSAHIYLFSHLFVRFNEFYYLYIRLTLIGFTINYFSPSYGWIITFPVLFFTGYQLLPLQHSLNDSSRIYPISTNTMKSSYKKLLVSLLILQLFLLNLASLIHIEDLRVVWMISLGMLFIYWFVYGFAAKRIFNL